MHRNSRLPTSEDQVRLLLSWHEMELAKVRYRIAMLEECLTVGPLEREELKRIFKEDTGEDLLNPDLKGSPAEVGLDGLESNGSGSPVLSHYDMVLVDANPALWPSSKSKCRRRQRKRVERYHEIATFLHHWAKGSLHKILKSVKKSFKKD